MNERSIFIEVLEIADPAARAEYLDRACASDPALRQRVQHLLNTFEQASGFMQGPAADLISTTDQAPAAEGPGTIIGPYKLLEQIGEGGFGVVYMAEQTEPVRRRVALKILKPGMDSRQVVARFEAERQALAIMDCPNIAKVFDGGATQSGRPYFVMELVKGVPITEYCDEQKLSPRQRLELFIPVCQAVQHAHQKGIIHRDLKPSNVLVSRHDSIPVPKVIDFGVAKALGQELTDKTLFTGIAQVIGTPLYMSPEQAGRSDLDIDTRSDIYSLGVLLYELLTATTPFTKERFKQAAYDEIRRIIREEEPPKPSTRLSDSKDSLPSISAQRQTEPAKLTKLVRGELDWIVMKALEKDRNRRYETANGFAQDIERYLADEPVQACPPSAMYRFRKFARRNKTALAVACLVLLFVVLIGGGGGWVIRDRSAREHRLAAQVGMILDEVDRLEREQKWPEALEATRRAEAALAGSEAGDALRQRVGDVRHDLAFVAELDRIRQDRAITIEGKFNNRGAAEDYRRVFREYGVDVEKLAVDEAVARLQAKPALALPIATALDDWVNARRDLGENAASWKTLVAVACGMDGDPLRNRLRAVWGRPVSPELQAELRQLAESIDVKAQRPATLIVLAWTLLDMRLVDLAIQIVRDGHYAYPSDFWLALELGLQFYKREDYTRAIRYFEVAVAIRPDSATGHVNLGSAMYRANDLEGAIRESRAALQFDPKNALVHFNLGTALYGTKDLEGAIREYRAALQINPNYGIAHCNLGVALYDMKDLDGAIREYRAALQIDANSIDAQINLGVALVGKNDLEGAIREFQAAIKIQSNNADAHQKLGLALRQKGDLDGAIREFQTAITIDPNFGDAHNNLGSALGEKNDLVGSIREHRAALRIQPNDPTAHYNLGNALIAKNELDGAIDEYRKAVGLKPDFAQAHCNLGQTLRRRGEIQAALEELRRGHELGSKIPGWPFPSAEWVRECERLVELDRKLPGFLDGKIKPASANERIELAELGYVKRLNRATARFYEDAFAAEPKLANSLAAPHRYNAACAAALAGCGQGKDADKLDEKEKTRLRGLALGWLRADLESWTKEMAKNTPEAPAAVREKMQHWQRDSDLAGVRDPEALANLPEAERQPWQKLWGDVVDVLKRAQGKTAPEKKAK